MNKRTPSLVYKILQILPNTGILFIINNKAHAHTESMIDSLTYLTV